MSELSEQLAINPPTNARLVRADPESDEIHLLDLLIVLARYKTLVVGMPILIGGLALVASLLIPPVFTSTAKILPPPQQSSGVAAALGQLGGLAGAVGGIGGLKTPGDLYVGLLESRTVADRLIARFKLQGRYEKKTMDETRIRLKESASVVNSKKDGLIAITINDRDPRFAANLANAYVDELIRLTQTMTLTEAAQRRAFFETQLRGAKDQLADAEVGLRKTQEKTGMIQPDGQIQAIIVAAAQLKGTIAAKEVELKAMRTFATVQNPALLHTQEELRGLQAQLAKLESSRSTSAGDFMVPTGRIPAVGVEYVRGVREVKYYETIFQLLAKQFELAKIDEAKDLTQIQLLDPAIPAERKSKPKRALITLAGVFGGGLFGVLLAFMLAAYKTSRLDPDSHHRWVQLSMAWKNQS